MHKRTFIYASEFSNFEEFLEQLIEARSFARQNRYATAPSIEAAGDGSAGLLKIYEETLSDQSTQLVAVVCA